MKLILYIPLAMIILLALFIEMIILLLPLLILYFLTGEDYSRRWMIKWSEKPLNKCGLKT